MEQNSRKKWWQSKSVPDSNYSYLCMTSGSLIRVTHAWLCCLEVHTHHWLPPPPTSIFTQHCINSQCLNLLSMLPWHPMGSPYITIPFFCLHITNNWQPPQCVSKVVFKQKAVVISCLQVVYIDDNGNTQPIHFGTFIAIHNKVNHSLEYEGVLNNVMVHLWIVW